MKTVKKILAVILSVMFVASCFAACSTSSNKDEKTSESTTAAAATGDTLVMATNASFPPYEYVDGSDYKGIDIEIAQAIADKLGMTLEINDVEFGSIVGGVQSGKYDMGIAGMTVTPDREKSVSFTDSYATGVQVVIVKNDSNITSIDDITGKKIGVQQDTTGDIYASDTVENGGFGEDNVIRYNKGADAVQALVSGKVDCVIIDNEPAKNFVEANSSLKILDTKYVEEQYAICVSKDNAELLNKVNNALKELKDDGTVQSIIDKYIPAA